MGGGGGGGGMMVKDLTKFHERHLGDRDMLKYMCVQCFIENFESWEGELRSVVLT